MPSLQFFDRSGGIVLVSGNIFSGSYLDYAGQGCKVGGIQFRNSATSPGPVYVCLMPLSGQAGTFNSGGSLSSGGLADGMELVPGGNYFVPRSRMTNLSGQGLLAISLVGPAASSGARIMWEPL